MSKVSKKIWSAPRHIERQIISNCIENPNKYIQIVYNRMVNKSNVLYNCNLLKISNV